MDNPGGVCTRQCVCDLNRVAKRFLQFETGMRDQAVQRLAWNVLHHQIVELAIGVEIVNGHNVGVI